MQQILKINVKMLVEKETKIILNIKTKITSRKGCDILKKKIVTKNMIFFVRKELFHTIKL